MERPSSIWDQIALLVGFRDPSLIYTYELDYTNKYGYSNIGTFEKEDDVEANMIMSNSF